MSETKHTPGPWRVYSTVIGGEPVHRVDGQRGGKPINWRPTLADAHLIAAAPDMLEALEAILSMLPRSLATTTWGDPTWTDAIRRVESAIKKARGEAPACKCERCGTTDGVTLAPCPYASDIHGDDTPVWLCGECRHERAMDV